MSTSRPKRFVIIYYANEWSGFLLSNWSLHIQYCSNFILYWFDRFGCHPIAEEISFCISFHSSLGVLVFLRQVSYNLQTNRSSMQHNNGVEVLTMITVPNQPNLWKIYLPTTLVANVIHWYHVTLDHVGTQQLYDTISNHFTSPRLLSLCRQYVCLHNCS